MRTRFARHALFTLLALAMTLGASPGQAQSHSRAEIEVLAEYYADYYGVPISLVRRVINRESRFNPAARNGPYYGLMQILPQTARTMGFRGAPAALLNAEVNLIHAVKYLRGAWLLANGSQDRAVRLYASGYYYDAKAAGMLETTGLRPGPRTIATPAPVGVDIALSAVGGQDTPENANKRRRTLANAIFGDRDERDPGPVPAQTVAATPAQATPGAAPQPVQVAVALEVLPPRRPAAPTRTARPPVGPAPGATQTLAQDGLDAIALASTPGDAMPAFEQLERDLEWASAYAQSRPAITLATRADLVGATFAVLEPTPAEPVPAELGADGFVPPERPSTL